MSGWWFAAGCVGLYLLLWAFSARKWKSQARALAQRRPNPSREEFLVMLADDCEPDVAAFLWGELLPEWTSWQEGMTPHPDDDFLKDLSIDDEEPQDWLEHYCDSRGLDWKCWTNWDRDQPTTVRNFARWLSNGRAPSAADIAA